MITKHLHQILNLIHNYLNEHNPCGIKMYVNLYMQKNIHKEEDNVYDYCRNQLRNKVQDYVDITGARFTNAEYTLLEDADIIIPEDRDFVGMMINPLFWLACYNTDNLGIDMPAIQGIYIEKDLKDIANRIMFDHALKQVTEKFKGYNPVKAQNDNNIVNENLLVYGCTNGVYYTPKNFERAQMLVNKINPYKD